MDLKKAVLVFSIVFVGLSVSQKTTVCSVYEDLSVDKRLADNGGRINSLVLEYFKSELATHSGIAISLPEPTATAVENAGMGIGKPLTAAQIKSVCAATKASVFCTVCLLNDPKKLGERIVKLKLYNASGVFLKEISSRFSHVREVDYVSIKLAQEAAKYVRGENCVDNMNSKRVEGLVRRKMISVPNSSKK